jgi:hypothetical protein
VAKRVYDIYRELDGTTRYVDNLLAESPEEAICRARRQYGKDITIVDASAACCRRVFTFSPDGGSAMKKDEVEVGKTYAAKISGEVVPVRIDKEHPRLKGWVATNEKTGEEVHIVSAQKLRGEWDEDATSSPEAGETTGGEPTPEGREEEAATDRTVAHESPMSGVDAAAKVLSEADEPLRVKEIYRRAEEAGYWRSDAQTPDRTLYSAILREMDKEGEDARFEKAGRGLFTVKD